ncbi:MAG: hypothetical protein WCO12_02635 [bacterium]
MINFNPSLEKKDFSGLFSKLSSLLTNNKAVLGTEKDGGLYEINLLNDELTIVDLANDVEYRINKNGVIFPIFDGDESTTTPSYGEFESLVTTITNLQKIDSSTSEN